jgi:hypothetical protein
MISVRRPAAWGLVLGLLVVQLSAAGDADTTVLRRR